MVGKSMYMDVLSGMRFQDLHSPPFIARIPGAHPERQPAMRDLVGNIVAMILADQTG